MQWGLFYLPTELPDTPEGGANLYRTVIDQVRFAEEIGFSSVWLAEHHFHRFGGMFPSTPMLGAAIAQHTRTIRIGPCSDSASLSQSASRCGGLRDPRLAKQRSL